MNFDLLDLAMLSKEQMVLQFHMIGSKEGKEFRVRAPVRSLPDHFIFFTIK